MMGVELAGVISNSGLIHLSRWQMPADWTGSFNWKVKELNPRSRLQQSKHNTAAIPNSTFMDKMTSKISLEISTKKIVLVQFQSQAKCKRSHLAPIFMDCSKQLECFPWDLATISETAESNKKASDVEMERVRYFWAQSMTGLELLCSV